MRRLLHKRTRSLSHKSVYVESLEGRCLFAAVDLAGNTLAQALAINITTSQPIEYNYPDNVSPKDRDDYYRVVLGASAKISVGIGIPGTRGRHPGILGNLQGDADLSLLDSSGTQIAVSSNGGKRRDTLGANLDPGIYYLHVYAYRHAKTKYDLQISIDRPSATVGSLTASAVSASEIDLQWNDNPNGEGSVIIDRSEDNQTWIQVSTQSYGAYQDTGLEPSKTYYYREYFTDDTKTIANSTTVVATTAATDLGLISGTDTVSGIAGGNAPTVYYKFEIQNEVDLSLTNDVAIQLTTSSTGMTFHLIGSSQSEPNSSGYLDVNADQGNWTVEVDASKVAVQSAFNLSISSTPYRTVYTTTLAGNAGQYAFNQYAPGSQTLASSLSSNNNGWGYIFYTGDYINGLGVPKALYSFGSDGFPHVANGDSLDWLLRAGDVNGAATDFVHEDGEQVNSVLVDWSGNNLTGLTIHTNLRTIGVGNYGTNNLLLSVPSGYQFIGFYGQSGNYINGIGLEYVKS